jgi:phosphoglycolate phosphatase-like HAD superfamily hydrolase
LGQAGDAARNYALFLNKIGAHFHFDGDMRDLIHHGVGKTLQEAIEMWEAEQRQPTQEKPIAPQFEYNRHIREYFKAHPGAPLQAAIQDWKVKKKARWNRSEVGV